MKQGAIFDMDGTLFDTEKFYTRGWIETADDFGVKRKPALAAAMCGRSLKEMPDIVQGFYPGIDAEEYARRVVRFAEKRMEEDFEMLPGVAEILKFFRANKIPMAIASSSGVNVIERNVKRIGIEKYFDALVGGNTVANGKPAPDIFLKAAEEIKVAPENCYVFEDSPNGIRGARAAKCVAIMIPDQIQPTSEIRDLADGIFDDMYEALDAIKRGKI